MYYTVLSLHILLAVVLVGLVLLQQGKGADVGAVMGGGGANSLFGVSGASNLLVKMTTSVAVAFMLTSVLLVRFAAAGAATSGGAVDPLRGSGLEGVAAQAAPSTATPAAAVGADVAPVAVPPVASAVGEPGSTTTAPTSTGDGAKSDKVAAGSTPATSPTAANSGAEKKK
jgi:preprotein translocase subunit SecG